jgi:hypothetical protein
MDAVLLALLILLPFFAFYLLQRWWVQRSPTGAIARRRRTFVTVTIIAALVVFKLSTTETKLHRILLNKCALEIWNDSGHDLHDLEYVLLFSDGETRTNHYETMSPRSGTKYSATGPTLTIQTLHGRAGTNHFSFTGKINKGERLHIHIGPSGQITPKLD